MELWSRSCFRTGSWINGPRLTIQSISLQGAPGTKQKHRPQLGDKDTKKIKLNYEVTMT